MKQKKAKPVISRKIAIFLGGMMVMFTCVCLTVFAYRAHHIRVTSELKPQTLEELLAIPDKDLGRVDIARMNLLCATGLPGAENIDVEKYLATLDEWTRVGDCRVLAFLYHHLLQCHNLLYTQQLSTSKRGRK